MMNQFDAVESMPVEERESWQAVAVHQLAERLRPPSDFPCVFSQSAFSRGKILFSFVPSLTTLGMRIATNDLRDYAELSRRWDGSVANAEPLIMFFCPNTIAADTVEGYHQIGWQILQDWHREDTQPWPAEVSRDPHSPYWAMCFGGMQLFVNMSSPKHHIRRSRNLGDALAFVINPRERFDIVAGNDDHGRRVRAQIRDRIEKYDGIPHAPQLGSYQAGELEWWQYGIPENNRSRTDRCPFKQRTEDDSSRMLKNVRQ